MTQTANTPRRTLYDISADYSDYFALLEAVDENEISEEDRDRLDSFFADLKTERDAKLEACGAFIKNVQHWGNGYIEEAKRLRRLGEVELNKADRVKERVLGFFRFHRIDETIKTARFKFRKQGNGGVRAIVYDEAAEANPESVPKAYRKQVWQLDRELIRVDLERLAGLEAQIEAADPEREAGIINAMKKEVAALRHALSFATLEERGDHLRIS